ncbi:MAG: DUF1702 family protein [Chitinophagales bacterium]|nr:DUF1702 family protein [Chitinophagales bacterium]
MSLSTKLRMKLFGVNKSQATFKKRKFTCDDKKLQDHLEQIGFYFLDGYHFALTSESHEELKLKLETIPDFYKGFSYEGAAMGLTIMEYVPFIGNGSFSKFLDGIGSVHNYMSFVGAGWALSRLPVKVSKHVHRYDNLLKYLVLDGHGFHEAFFNTDKIVRRGHIPNYPGYQKCAFAQGAGRALWFVFGANPEQIKDGINKFPEKFHPDLWSGVGLAATYASGVGETVIRDLKSIANGNGQHLAQGAVFAAKARRKAGLIDERNEMACSILTGMPVFEAAQIADDTLTDLPVVNSTERPSYEIWRSRIRYRISEQPETQLTKKNQNEKAIL